jgi:transposase
MYNDNTELLKLVHLSQFDVDNEHTTIHVDISSNEITIHLYINPGFRDCPYCKSTGALIYDRKIKRISHPIIEKRKITIIFHQIKFQCKECGHYFMQFNPIVSGSKNISKIGELYILETLRNPRRTFKDIEENLFIPQTSVIRCFDEHVNLNRHNLSKVLCFDEIYAKKLTKTKYAFVIYDPLSSTVIDVLDARLKDCLTDYFARIPIKERLKVEYVNIDMWETYKLISQQAFPNATICVDSFHVIKHLNDAMDKIRLQVQRKFLDKKDEDRNGYYWLLKTFHYYFVQDFNNIKYERKPNSHYSYLWSKHDVLNKILSIDKNLADSYWLKEEYREFNLCGTYEEALYKIDDFIERFKKAHYVEFREFASMLERWKYEIINSFLVVDGKRMSNGPMESLNGRIKRLLHDGYGYSNFDRFRNRLMYCLNKNESVNFNKK